MPQITRAVIETAASLGTRKGRRSTGLFKAEGTKCVLDTLGYFRLHALYATSEWISAHPDVRGAIEAGRGELRRMSDLTTPGDVIALYEIPEAPTLPDPANELVLALDTIQDPGNLGTIIRVADWFGVTSIIASRETADCFSPKVIQATMGSIARVRVTYCDLPEVLGGMSCPIYGTFLDGAPISDAGLTQNGVIIIGNEGNGISPEVGRLVTERLLIPSWPPGRTTGESLNAAIATAITLAKFRGV